MVNIEERTVSQSTSGSKTLCLPIWWCRNNGIAGGSRVQLSLDELGRLVVEPTKGSEAKNEPEKR